MKMMFRPFVLIVFIGMTVVAEENCTSKKVSTHIDQTKTKMELEEQLFVINAVTNATLIGGDDFDVVNNIFDAVNPIYNKEKIWSVLEIPYNGQFWSKGAVQAFLSSCAYRNDGASRRKLYIKEDFNFYRRK